MYINVVPVWCFVGLWESMEKSYTDVELEDSVDHVVVFGSASVSVDTRVDSAVEGVACPSHNGVWVRLQEQV